MLNQLKMLKPKEHQAAHPQKPQHGAHYQKKVANSKVKDVLGKIAQVQRTTSPHRHGHFRNASFQDTAHSQNERALTNYERIQLLQTEGIDLTNYQKNIAKQALQIRHEQSVRLQNRNKDIKAIDQSGGQNVPEHNTTRIMQESRITEKHETSLRSSLHMDAQSNNGYNTASQKPIVKVSGLPIENGMPEAPVEYQEAIQSNRIGFDQEDSIQTPWPILENSKELASPFQINNTAEDDASSPSVLEHTLQVNSRREKQDVVLIDPESGGRAMRNYFDQKNQMSLDNPNNPKKLEIKVQSNMNLTKVANSPDPADFARDIHILDKVQIDAKPNTAEHNRRNQRGRGHYSVNPASPYAQPFSNGSPLTFQMKTEHMRNTNMSGQSTNMATYYVNQRQLVQTAGENRRRNMNPNMYDLTSLNQPTFMNRSKMSTHNNKQPKTSNFEGSSSDPFGKNTMLHDALSTGNTQLGNVQIHSRLYSRDGSINDRGTPFFIEQIHKERMIRTNKSFRRRQQTRFKSNCVPLGSNYINDRILSNKKHFEKCKGRQMVIFEQEMVNQQQMMHRGLQAFESGTGENQIIVVRQDQGVQLSNQSTKGPLSVDGGKVMNLINTGDGLISGFDVAHISNRMYSNHSNSHRSQEGLDIKKLFSTNGAADQPKIINHDHPQKTELAVYGLGKQMTSVTPTLQQNGGGTSCQSPERQTVQMFEKYSSQYDSPHRTLYRRDAQKLKDQFREKSETVDRRSKQQADQQFELAVFNSFNLEENSLIVQNQNKQVKYQPIPGRLQRLSSQKLVMAKLGSRESKQATSNDLGATNSPMLSSKNTKSGNGQELKIQTGNGNAKVSAPQKKLSEPKMKDSPQQESFIMGSSFNGGRHHYILAPKQQKPPEKPLWVCNKKPKSRVVNYKSMEGRRMKKLSAGDPGRQEWQQMKDALKTQVLHPILSKDQKQLEEMRQAEQQLNQIPSGQGGKIVYGLKGLKVGIQSSFAPPGKNRTISKDFENLNISASKQREVEYLQSIRGATPDTNAVHGGGSQVASCGIDEIPTAQQEIDIKNTFQRNKESFETVTKNINTIPSQPLHTLQSSQPMLHKTQQPAYTPRIDEIQNQGGFHLEDENHENKERSSLEFGVAAAVPETTRTRQKKTQQTSSTGNLNSLPLDNSIIAKRYETLDKQMKAKEMSPKEHKVITLGGQTSKKSRATVEHMSFGKSKTPFNGFQNNANHDGPIHLPQSQPMSTPADLSGRTSIPMKDYSHDEKKDLETISQNLSGNANNRSPSVDNKSHQSKVVYQRKTEPTSHAVITSKEALKKDEEELFEMDSKEKLGKELLQNTKNSSQELIQGLLNEPGKAEDNPGPNTLGSAVSKKERVSNIQGPSLDISVIQENDHFEMCEMIGTVVVNSTFEKADQIITDNSAAFKQKQMELQKKVDSQLGQKQNKPTLSPKSRNIYKIDTDRYSDMQACAEGFMIQQIKRSEFTSPAHKMVDQSAGQTTSGKREVNVAHQNTIQDTSRPRDSVSTINQQLGPVSKFRQNSPRPNQQPFNLDNKVSVMSEKEDHTPATIYVKDHSNHQDQSIYNSMQASFLEQKNDKKSYNLSQILSDHNKQQDYIESQIGDKVEDLVFGQTAAMDEDEIEMKAQSNVNEKTRQPIHRNPPRYLQKENFGIKFAYQQTMQQRVRNRKSESCGGSHVYSSHRSGKQESLMSTVRGENAVVGKEALNIRNLCNQMRSKTTNGGKYGRLRAVGIVQGDQQGRIENLTFEQNSHIGSIFEKEQHFYQNQLDKIQCPKAKNLVSPACDPAYRVIESSQLTPRALNQKRNKRGLVQNRKEKIDVRTSMHFKKNSQCSNMQNTSYDGEQSQNRIQAADVSALLKGDRSRQEQTFSVNQIQATQKKQALTTEAVYDYGDNGPATSILQPRQPYQGQMSKTGSFESRERGEETPFNNREEPMLEPTMTNDELKQISTTRQQMSTTRNQASTNRRISTTRHPGFKVKHSFDSRKESRMSSSYPTPFPQASPHIVDIVASDSRMSQGHGLSYTQQAAILQQYGTQDNVSKNHQTGVSRNSLHVEAPNKGNCRKKKAPAQANKSNFKQGVHRDFRGLVDPLKIEGIIDKTGSHLKQFKRQRSNTLVKQLANKRKGIRTEQQKQRSKSNGAGVLVLFSNTNNHATEQPSLILNQEYIHPLQLIQDAQSEHGPNDRVAESNSYAHMSQQNANKDLQESQLSHRSQHLFATKKMITEKKVTANFEMNNSKERGDTGKITIDSVGIQELYSAQDLTDDFPNQKKPTKKQKSMQQKQAEQKNPRRQQRSCLESRIPIGERELFDLPTSVVQDLIAEQKELNEREIINFGLIGKTTELKPLPESQERAHAPLQNFFKTKQNVTLRKEPSNRRHICQKFEMAQRKIREQREGFSRGSKYQRYNEQMNGVKSVPVSLSLNGTTSRMSDAYSAAHTPQTKVMANYGQLSIRNSDGDVSPER